MYINMTQAELAVSGLSLDGFVEYVARQVFRHGVTDIESSPGKSEGETDFTNGAGERIIVLLSE